MSVLSATKLGMRAVMIAALALAAGCPQTTELATSQVRDAQSEDAGGTDTRDAASDAAAQDATFIFADAGTFFCGTAPCACSNGLDDDGDMLIDGLDPECTGPYDNDEETFGTGEPPDNGKCMDCFFDGKKRGSNDRCKLPRQCLETGAPEPGCGNTSCEATTECQSNCLPFTPNGCDCFGCCEVSIGEQTWTIQLVDTCKLDRDTLNSPACPSCRLSTTCFNPCEACELCPGRTLADLSNCADGFVCSEGRAACDPAATSCPSGQWCSQGCCQPVPVF